MTAEKSFDQLLARKQLLIFDFDGTIADTSPLHAEAFTKVLDPLGVTVDYPAIAGLKTSDAMRKLLDETAMRLSEADVHALVTAKQALVREFISEKLEPLPGVHEFLLWAKSRYKLSMASSGSRGTVQLALAKLGYSSLFEPLLCAEDVTKAKPDPEIFLTVLRDTGMQAEQAIVFEDSNAGLRAAHFAGIECIDVRNISWNQFAFLSDQAS